MKFDLKTIITTLIIVLSFIGGVLAFDDRYATSKELARLEQQTVQSLKDFRDDWKRETLEQRYLTLGDQALQLRLYIKKDPADKQLQEDLEKVNKEREKVREELEKLRR